MSKSRAEYFKKRRQIMGQFYAMVNKDLLIKLDIKLKDRQLSRTSGLLKCIERALNEEGE